MKKATITLYIRPVLERPGSYEQVGYHAFDMFGYSFVVHRKVYAVNGKWRVGDTWGVSETTCGAKVLGDAHTTRVAAIASARARLEDVGKETLDAAVKGRLLQRAKDILEA